MRSYYCWVKMESYSKRTKEALKALIPKKNCCKRIAEDFHKIEIEADFIRKAEMIRSIPSHFKCASCKTKAVSMLFILYGNITDPDKQYHLEFSFKSSEERAAAEELLSISGFELKPAMRKNRFLLYTKSSGRIEDFLAIIGANRSAFDLMNAKIVREVRGDANRQMNCDMANINKTIAAAEHIVDAIAWMHETGTILRLPAELRETALLRFENTQASMSELGAMHDPSISKSGVKHRLDKIESAYHKFKEELK